MVTSTNFYANFCGNLPRVRPAVADHLLDCLLDSWKALGPGRRAADEEISDAAVHSCTRHRDGHWRGSRWRPGANFGPEPDPDAADRPVRPGGHARRATDRLYGRNRRMGYRARDADRSIQERETVSRQGGSQGGRPADDHLHRDGRCELQFPG